MRLAAFLIVCLPVFGVTVFAQTPEEAYDSVADALGSELAVQAIASISVAVVLYAIVLVCRAAGERFRDAAANRKARRSTAEY